MSQITTEERKQLVGRFNDVLDHVHLDDVKQTLETFEEVAREKEQADAEKAERSRFGGLMGLKELRAKIGDVVGQSQRRLFNVLVGDWNGGGSTVHFLDEIVLLTDEEALAFVPKVAKLLDEYSVVPDGPTVLEA